MTEEQFKEWMNEQIVYLISIARTDYGDARLETLEEVIEKYLSILPPPQSTN